MEVKENCEKLCRSFNLLENSTQKNRFQFLSMCLDIVFLFAYTWWDEPRWMPGAYPNHPIGPLHGQGRGNTTKDSQGEEKDKRRHVSPMGDSPP